MATELWKTKSPKAGLGAFRVKGWLEVDAAAELRGTARVGLRTRDLSKAGVAEHCAGNRELGVVGDVVQIGLEAQSRGFSEVKGEAATKADVQVIVAGTVDVVRSGTRRVAEDEVWGRHECTGVYEKRCARWRVEIGACDSVAPFAIDARRASEAGIVSRHAGARARERGLRGIGSAAHGRDGQRRAGEGLVDRRELESTED